MRSVRDSDSNSKLWAKNRSIGNQGGHYGNAIAKIQRQISQLRRRIVAGPTVLDKHPFQIYQPTNFASFSTGVLFTSVDGSGPTTCNVDASVPTDFSASPPTVNPSTDAWRFWAVRSGEIELRPLYHLNPSELPSLPEYNSSWKFQVFQNSDGIGPYVASAESPIPITSAGYDDASTQTSNPPLIIGPNGGGADGPGGFYKFAFWVKVTPDNLVDLPIVEIQARDGSLFDNPFPESTPNLIPIGLVVHSTELTIDQMIFDNIVNRYPPGSGTFCSGSWMNFRGNWNKDTGDFDPPDLDQQIFYPGDCVFAKSGSASVMFQLSRNIPIVWQDPFLATVGTWKRVWQI